MKIEKINNYEYTLVDGDNKVYIKNIEFYSNYKPQVNDILCLDDSILKEINLYAFDEVNDTDNVKIEDIIKVIHKDREYYFERQYG